MYAPEKERKEGIAELVYTIVRKCREEKYGGSDTGSGL
jgi:hypothetical protein